MPSAIATENIFPGAAVAQKGDTASLASPSKLASHIVQTGGPVKGIVSMIARGTVFLDDWSLATGSRQLMVGVTYFVGVGGKLVTFGGQPVGIAITKNSLSVTIQDNQASTGTQSADTSATQATLASLQSQINILAGQAPKLFIGSFAIPDASNAGSVTGLAITSFTPTKAVPTVRAPAGGLVLFANPVATTITKDGFDFVLSGLTDSGNYILDFVLGP